jgi:hypothetical protein
MIIKDDHGKEKEKKERSESWGIGESDNTGSSLSFWQWDHILSLLIF